MLGFAYVTNDGEIDIKTVSDTRTAAKVNAITTVSGGRLWCTNEQTDAQIDHMFRHVVKGQGVVRAVEIKVAEAIAQNTTTPIFVDRVMYNRLKRKGIRGNYERYRKIPVDNYARCLRLRMLSKFLFGWLYRSKQ